jgi:hypothetical protein
MVTITLPPELEQVVTERAHGQGTTPELLVIDSLEKLYLSPAVPPVEDEKTLADYWADYIGTVDSSELVPGGANLSQNTGRKFAELMVEKYRKTRP